MCSLDQKQQLLWPAAVVPTSAACHSRLTNSTQLQLVLQISWHPRWPCLCVIFYLKSSLICTPIKDLDKGMGAQNVHCTTMICLLKVQGTDTHQSGSQHWNVMRMWLILGSTLTYCSLFNSRANRLSSSTATKWCFPWTIFSAQGVVRGEHWLPF